MLTPVEVTRSRVIGTWNYDAVYYVMGEDAGDDDLGNAETTPLVLHNSTRLAPHCFFKGFFPGRHNR